MKGRLVVVEGIDGSGKRTQCNFLEKSLKEIGYRSKIYGFPDYAASAVGPVIRRMLSGEFGDSSRFDPRMIAPLFALDRFEKRDEIIKNLSAGYIVICDRYVYSNVAHQLSRVSESEREDLKEWIENLEFNILGLPKADLTVLLDIEVNLAAERRDIRSLRSNGSRPLDDYERDLQGITMARDVYLRLAKDLSWRIIPSSKSISVCEVHALVKHAVLETLN